eukprot:8063697-Alexandrium_andersonii.AAC.1
MASPRGRRTSALWRHGVDVRVLISHESQVRRLRPGGPFVAQVQCWNFTPGYDFGRRPSGESPTTVEEMLGATR